MKYVLFLRDMRSPHLQSGVGILHNMDELGTIVDREAVPEYEEEGQVPLPVAFVPMTDGEQPRAAMPQRTVTWHKVFRKGGPLEWYLPPESEEESILLALPDPTQARILVERLIKEGGAQLTLRDQARLWHQYATQLENWQQHQDFKLPDLA